MRIRETDQNGEEEREEIRQERDRKPLWIQASIAAALAVASALGGYQVTQLSTDPSARPDPFTGTEARQMREDFESKIRQKSEFNAARWQEIAAHMETQYKTMERLSETVRQMLARCAEVQANDNSMQRQIEANARRLEKVEGMLFTHLGLTKNGHEKGM